MNFLATRRPRLDVHARLKPRRDPDVVTIVICVAILIVWSVLALIGEFTKVQP